ncbi:hypothetical protein CR513_30398, partial [Mucuna pruriens]
MKGAVEMGGVVSAVVKHEDTSVGVQQILPKKCQDMGIFSIPCTIGNCTFVNAMLDLRASINIMPASACSKGAETVYNRHQIAGSNSSQKESQQTKVEPDFSQPTPSTEEKSDHQQFSVIIANNLSQEQEEKLLNVLRKHKKAISWTLADLPWINTSIFMHKILLEEDA